MYTALIWWCSHTIATLDTSTMLKHTPTTRMVRIPWVKQVTADLTIHITPRAYHMPILEITFTLLYHNITRIATPITTLITTPTITLNPTPAATLRVMRTIIPTAIRTVILMATRTITLISLNNTQMHKCPIMLCPIMLKGTNPKLLTVPVVYPSPTTPIYHV
jgi:hypothetical protein